MMTDIEKLYLELKKVRAEQYAAHEREAQLLARLLMLENTLAEIVRRIDER